MRARLIVFGCIAVVGCKATPPSGYGVNLTVSAHALSSAQLAAIAQLHLHVTGAESYDSAIDATKILSKGEAHIRYVPGVRSGTIVLGVVATGGNPPASVASGVTGSLTLDGKSTVSALVNLVTGSPTCSDSTQCGSGFCVDGFCCDGACDGTCESCAVAGSEGRCTPIPMGTDPDNECGAKVGAVGDGGTEDGGAAPVDMGLVTVPDGGVVRDPSQCKGACNGSGACVYPGATQSCGSRFCNTAADVVSLQCDGTGGCSIQHNGCTDYSCGGSGVCNSSCSQQTDCQSTDYCTGNSSCVKKKGISIQCNAAYECQSGYCVGTTTKYCCTSACNDTGMACDTPGSEGICTCAGKTCANGCQLYYLDNDGDGHGDVNGTVAANSAVAGCVGSSSVTVNGKNYYPAPLNDDCDDTDPNVYPPPPGGSRGWFTTASLHRGFDYDCDNKLEYEYPQYPNASCLVCNFIYNGGNYYCGDNGAVCPSTTTAYNAAGLGINMGTSGTTGCGFNCYVGPNDYQCCPNIRSGFNDAATVQCGAAGNYVTCGNCPSGSTTPANTYQSLTQGCH